MTDRGDTAYRSAALLALLIFLWGALSLVFVPWRPFGAPNLSQTVVGAVALVYFSATRGRQNRRAAVVFAVLAIGYTLLLLPWTAIAWCQLGRPLEAFTVPQIAVITVPLVIPAGRVLGLGVMSAFVCECLFAYFYAHHIGLAALIPITEPIGSIGFAVFGVMLFMTRAARHVLTDRHTRAQGELDALARLTPLFAEVRDELDAGLAVLGAEARAAHTPQRLGRTLGRLDDVRARLAALLGGAPPAESTRAAERRLLDADAQYVVAAFIATFAAIAVVGLLLGWPPLMRIQALTIVAAAILGLQLIYLVATRRRPSARHATAALLVLVAVALPIIAYNQRTLLDLGRPYSPFLGYYLLMIAVGFAATARRWLGIGLILVVAAAGMAEFFVLNLGQHRDLVPLSEPWILVVFVLIALIASRMREQRRLASVQLLRAETASSALYRRTAMLLALSDRLNTPLQTLVVDAELVRDTQPPENQARVRAAVERLVALSRRLAARDAFVPLELWRASLDADAELRRQS